MQEQTHAWAALMPPALEYLVFHLLAAVLLLILGWIASVVAGRIVKKLMLRIRHIDNTVVPVVERTTVWLLRIFVVIAVLARFGVQTASLPGLAKHSAKRCCGHDAVDSAPLARGRDGQYRGQGRRHGRRNWPFHVARGTNRRCHDLAAE